MLDTLVLNSGIAKGRSGRAQALPNAQKDRGTLIEQSYYIKAVDKYNQLPYSAKL